MTSSRLFIAVLWLGLGGCHAPTAPGGAADPRQVATDPVAAAKAAATEFDHAQLVGDRATLERYLASDFVFIRGSGVQADRTAFVAAFTDPDQKLEPFVVEHPIALRLADGAILIGGEATLRGTDKGTPFAEHIRYADIFQLRDARWQVVYTQVTMLR
jgi:hypothetical protein